MPLTRRQEEFVQKLIDLNDEFDGLIHYSVLADRLGVSPFTAYDMLCMLERKGFVISEYQRPTQKKGPGRAERLFSPSAQALGRKPRLSKNGLRKGKKNGDTRSILAHLRSGNGFDDGALQALLTRLPENRSQDLSFCAEVMQIATLRMQDYASWPEFRQLALGIFSSNAGIRQNLLLLSGVLIGFLAQGQTNETEWMQLLTEQLQHVNEILLNLSQEECRQLAESVHAFLSHGADSARAHESMER